MTARSRTSLLAVLGGVAALAAWQGVSASAAAGQAVAAAGQSAQRPAPHVFPDQGPMRLALTGDSIIVQALSPHKEPEFTRLIDMIRGADAAFTNLEMLFHDYEPFPSTQSGGTYMRGDPSLAKELVWAGFDLVAQANNHTNDYGVEGAQLTDKYVRQAGLVGAGYGNSLREAREARYVETDKGRVALVSVSSSFPDPSRAGDSWGDTKARPGLAPLRFRTTQVVTKAQFDALQAAVKTAGVPLGGGGGGEGGGGAAAASATEMTVLGRRFVVGDKAEVRTEPLQGRRRGHGRGGQQRQPASRLRDRVVTYPRERRQPARPARVLRHVRTADGRRRRRRDRHQRPARPARHRDLQGPPDFLLAG